MTSKTKYKIITMTTVLFMGMMTLFAWIKPADTFSQSERRRLEQFPEISLETFLSGKFMSDFESYAKDQFPLREGFRRLKALFATEVLNQGDNNGIYIVDGYAGKLDYPLNETGLLRAAERFRYIYDRYMAETDVNVYFSMIPDKNYFLAEENGYPSMDYEELFQKMLENTDYMEYIDITDLLSIEDYYKTDIHWRQEEIVDVAKRLMGRMGRPMSLEYKVDTLDQPFYGVYYGQSALPLKAEAIHYLTNEMLDDCLVYDWQNDQSSSVYDMEKAHGRDPYEIYLSGALSLITIENPAAASDAELILFRDSFGSSIAPLFIEGYSKITLVDIRYMHPDLLGKYMEFKDQDVLFLYSTSVLNHGETIK